jgi:serine/threonine-protein kinase SRPK3
MLKTKSPSELVLTSRDSNNEYVAIKVCTRNVEQAIYARRELQFYEHVRSINSQHPGQSFVRNLRETFELSGPDGQHLCLVHSPMHMTIRDLQYMNPSHKLNETLLRWTLSNILQALSYLHEEVKVTHAGNSSTITKHAHCLMVTDINPSNIMLTIADKSLLEDVEKNEAMNLLPRKIIDSDRTIYSSHKLGLPKDSLWGQPALCDFGEARIGTRHKGLIQPELYRAPEVLFDMEWDSKVDIWSIATMVGAAKPVRICLLTTLST